MDWKGCKKFKMVKSCISSVNGINMMLKVKTVLIPCLTQCQFRVNFTNRLIVRFQNITPLPIHFQLNLNNNTESVNSLIVLHNMSSKVAVMYVNIIMYTANGKRNEHLQ